MWRHEGGELERRQAHVTPEQHRADQHPEQEQHCEGGGAEHPRRQARPSIDDQAHDEREGQSQHLRSTRPKPSARSATNVTKSGDADQKSQGILDGRDRGVDLDGPTAELFLAQAAAAASVGIQRIAWRYITLTTITVSTTIQIGAPKETALAPLTASNRRNGPKT